VHADAAALNLKLPPDVQAQLTGRGKVGGAVTSEPIQVEVLTPPSDVPAHGVAGGRSLSGRQCKFHRQSSRGPVSRGPVQLTFDKEPPGVTFKVARSPTSLTRPLSTGGDHRCRAKKVPDQRDPTGPQAPDGKVRTVTEKFTLDVKPFDSRHVRRWTSCRARRDAKPRVRRFRASRTASASSSRRSTTRSSRPASACRVSRCDLRQGPDRDAQVQRRAVHDRHQAFRREVGKLRRWGAATIRKAAWRGSRGRQLSVPPERPARAAAYHDEKPQTRGTRSR